MLPIATVRLPAALLLALPLAAVPFAAARAQGTSEQRAACTGDAMRLCLADVPDVGKITACMKSHYGELSPRCQATFHEASPAAPPRKLAAEPAAKPAPAVRQAEARPAEHPMPRSMPHGAAHLARFPAGRPAAGAARDLRAARGLRTAAVERRTVPSRRDLAEAPRRDASRDVAAPMPTSRETASSVPYPAPVRSPSVLLPPPYPAIAGGPLVAPRPQLVTGLSASTGSLANACRLGLIDSYTCGNTIPALGLSN